MIREIRRGGYENHDFDELEAKCSISPPLAASAPLMLSATIKRREMPRDINAG